MLENKKNNKFYNKISLRITLIYMVVSSLWILFSDKLLLTNPATIIYVSTAKGWVYTVVVSIFIYFTITREFNKRNRLELRYRRLFEAAKDGILLIDFETGMIIDVNQFLINLLNYSKADFLEKYLWEVGVFKDVAASKENFATLQEKKYVRFEDLPLETRAGKKIQVEFVANAYWVGNKMVIQCNVRDITERKKMEKEIKWLASFPLLNPMPIIEIDKEKGLIFINDATKKLFPDFESQQLDHLFVKDVIKYFTILNNDTNNSVEHELEINNRWYLQTFSLVGPNNLRIYAADITTQKNNEEKLKDLDKLKDNFISTTSHELKTPLVPIKAQVQLLLDGDYGLLSSEQKQAIVMIQRNEENLNRLTSNLMDISKIKSNKLALITEKIDLSELITSAILDLQNLAQEKKIDLILSPLINIPTITADRLRISQVITNLIDNAIKFTPEGGKIKITAENNKNTIDITVQDNGIGLSPENLKKLFTPFFQVQNDLNKKYRGTGLGLVVAKGIVEAHGGTIWAESAGEQQGSSFKFNLPIN